MTALAAAHLAPLPARAQSGKRGVMEAGRELDALVAEKVMGCKLWRKRDALLAAKDQTEYERMRHRPDYWCECSGQPHLFVADDGGGAWLMEYSTDIAAAWAVVDAFTSGEFNGYTCHASIKFNGSMSCWYARFAWGTERHEADASTAAEAICLAALKANGTQIAARREERARVTRDKVAELEALLRATEADNFRLSEEIMRLKGVGG